MTITEPRGVLSSPGPATDRLTLCGSCRAALLIDAGRYQVIHTAECPADLSGGGQP